MPANVLLQAKKRGVHLYLKGEELAFKAPPGAINEQLRSDIKQHKSAIINFLKQITKKNNALPAIKKIVSEHGSDYPKNQGHVLSFAQQRLWFIDNIEEGSAHYNMPNALRLSGRLQLTVVKQAFLTIFERHQSLRTCFVGGDNGQPVQHIQTVSDFDIPVVDLSDKGSDEQSDLLQEMLAVEANKDFDLSQDLMLRAQCVKFSEQEHVLLVTMHHIASDGWSMGILTNEFSALYKAYSEGQENPLAPLAIQYVGLCPLAT